MIMSPLGGETLFFHGLKSNIEPFESPISVRMSTGEYLKSLYSTKSTRAINYYTLCKNI